MRPLATGMRPTPWVPPNPPWLMYTLKYSVDGFALVNPSEPTAAPTVLADTRLQVTPQSRLRTSVALVEMSEKLRASIPA